MQLNPLPDGVFVIPVDVAAAASILTVIVFGSTPESLSVTVQVIFGVLFVIVAPSVGEAIVITGGVFP